MFKIMDLLLSLFQSISQVAVLNARSGVQLLEFFYFRALSFQLGFGLCLGSFKVLYLLFCLLELLNLARLAMSRNHLPKLHGPFLARQQAFSRQSSSC